MKELGRLKARKERNEYVYDFKHDDLWIEIRIKENPVIQMPSADVMAMLKGPQQLGNVAEFEVPGGIAEIRVKSINTTKALDETVLADIVFNGHKWNLDVYAGERNIGENFVMLMHGGIKNSLDYANIYLEFNYDSPVTVEETAVENDYKNLFEVEGVIVREHARQILDSSEIEELIAQHAQLKDDTHGEDNHVNLRAIELKQGNVITLYKRKNTIIYVHTVFRSGVNAGTFIYTSEER